MIKHILKALMFLGCVAMAAPAWAAGEANRTTTPDGTKFYRLISGYPYAATKAAYANDLSMQWKTLDEADATAIWVFTPGSAAGKYTLRNAYNGLYQQTQNGNSSNFILGTAKPEVTVSQIGTSGQVCILNTRAMHTSGWSGGNAGTLVGWQTSADANSASSWYIEVVDNDEAVIATLKEHYLGAIAHLSAANQAKFAAEVAVINNSASGASQILDAYAAIQAKLPEVINYVPVTSEAMLQTGGKYVLGFVGTNATAWVPRNPMCFKANADGNTFDFESKPNLDFTPDMIWTASVNPNYSCNLAHANHNGPHKVLQLSQNFNGTEKALKLLNSTNKNLAAKTDAATNLEFVPNTTVEAFAGEFLFQLHVNPSNSANFQQIFMINPNGGIGWYSRSQTGSQKGWDLNVIGAGAGLTDSWSPLLRAYMVISADDFAGAAAALWKVFQEEECATSESEHYQEQVNAMPVPDISALTNAATFIDDLRAEFQKELFNLEADYTATVTPLTVHYNTNNATGWNHTLLDTKGAFVKIIAHSGTSEGLAGNITKLDDNTFDFRNGQAKRSRYVFECYHPGLTIMGISFKASSTATTEYVTVDGEDIQITSEPKTIIASEPVLEFHGNNQQVRITDLKIKYRHSAAECGVPAQSGWYSILAANNLDAYASKWVVSLDKDVKQNETNYYCLSVADDLSNAPAAGLIYIDVNGDNRYFKSPNGHYVNENGTTSRTRGSNTRFRNVNDANRTAVIGNYWNSYNPNVDGVTYDLIGQGGAGANYYWATFKENPDELYDIWTVNITGVANAAAIQDDMRVECTNAANKGLAKVYNSGNFFFTKGATVSAADFVAEDVADGSLYPVIKLDAANKTVNVNYCSKQQLKDMYYTSVNNGYDAYRDICLFDADAIDAAVAAHKAAVDAAAGEEATVTAAQVAAMDAAVAAGTFTEGLKQIRNTAAGKLVQFRSFDHTNLYMGVAEVSDGNYRLNGLTDNTANTTIWQIETADAAQGTVYLKNYGTGLWMQNVNSVETNIPAAAADPASFEFEAYMLSNKHVIGVKSTANATYRYLHQVSGRSEDRIVKWSDPINSHASAWTVMLAEDDEISDGFDVTYEEVLTDSQHMVFSHAQGVSLHDNYCDELHTIVITKAKGGMRQAQARAGEDSEAMLVTPDKLTYDATRGTVSFPINENGLLEEGQAYDVAIPAGLVKIGDNKLSKADNRTFTYTEAGTTGIKEVTNAANAEVVYDIMGRRLAAPVKGLNIVNGKKVLVK